MHESHTTPIILIRNSRTAVKRAKLEFNQSTKAKTYSSELDGMKHQLLGYDKPKMNCKLTIC